MGRGEGSTEMKRAYMREKPVCDGVPVIAMPGVPWEACCQGPRGRVVGWEGDVPEPGVAMKGGVGMSKAVGDRGQG